MTVTWKDEDAANHFVSNREHIPCMEYMFEAALRMVRDIGRPPRRIVDLGCGSGATGGAMHRVWPDAQLVLADYSPPMLKLARENYGGEENVTIVEADLIDPGVMRRLCSEPVDAVVSSAAIHHLPRERQRALYEEVLDVLTPGGAFVNIEHTASACDRTEAIWWRWFYDKMAESRSATGTPTTWEQVRDEIAPRQEVNILTRVDTQVRWLRDMGYEDADCVFKVFEMAVFGGYKPA